MTRLGIGLVAATVVLISSLSARAADPAETCERAKRKATAKYTACRYKADAKALAKGATPDYGRCVFKASTYFGRAEVRAGAGVCKSEGDIGQVLAEVNGAIDEIYAGLAGGGYSHICGDGVIGGNESCDDTDLDGNTCQGLGFTSGTLACTSGCGFDVSDCANNLQGTCGNGVIDGNESCDGSEFGGATCESLGFSSGTLACTQGCGFDVSGCETVTLGPCGNGVIDETEACDGLALGGQTCQSAGYNSGLLGCTAGCQLDLSGCVTAWTYNSVPATGQTTAFGAGSDGDVQAGCPQSYTDNADGTITDNCTGLMWEKKDDSGGLHDKDNTYTWSGASWGSTYIMDGTIQDFIDDLNDVAGGGANCFASHCDWRVPNINELGTLVEHESRNPAINSAFHRSGTCAGCQDVTDPSCSCTWSTALCYWSSTTFPDYPDGAMVFEFFDGLDGICGKRGECGCGHVRAVRIGS